MKVHLDVSVATQKLVLSLKGARRKSYLISTSAFGTGNVEGSNQTPLGSFRICEKYGSSAAIRTIFIGRKAQGIWEKAQTTKEDLVLTRILRLEGQSSGVENTYYRYIYIHGTNQEERIGEKTSHGCIRMRNDDIKELFDMVTVGAIVEIH